LGSEASLHRGIAGTAQIRFNVVFDVTNRKRQRAQTTQNARQARPSCASVDEPRDVLGLERADTLAIEELGGDRETERPSSWQDSPLLDEISLVLAEQVPLRSLIRRHHGDHAGSPEMSQQRSKRSLRDELGMRAATLGEISRHGFVIDLIE